MQFSIIALLSLVAVAVASPVLAADAIVARSPQVAAEDAAMTDASGNVVAFNSASVHKTTVARSPQVAAEDAAMTDASGNVVAFNSASVHKTGAAASS